MTALPVASRHWFWARLWRQRGSRWALRGLGLAIFLVVGADFIANDKPLACSLGGKRYFPVGQAYLVALGWSKWAPELALVDWSALNYDWVWYPPIPYSHTSIDHRNLSSVSPFGPQEISSWRFRHWLGTDRTGHDVLAALIHGTRTALLTSAWAMLVAGGLGVLLGALAGYFGDEGLRPPRLWWWCNAVALPFAWFYCWLSPLASSGWFWPWFGLVGVMGVANLLAWWGVRQGWGGGPQRIRIDHWIGRLIEVIDSIPGLLLLLSLAVLLAEPNIYTTMAFLGLISWTGIARLVRAEMLRIRQLPYIEAARALGYSHWRIIWYHALPNILPPLLIVLAFGMAGAILVEASLSVLGIGVAAEATTWGALLRQIATSQAAEWWLALFPGMAIFLAVLLFNYLGDAMSRALDR